MLVPVPVGFIKTHTVSSVTAVELSCAGNGSGSMKAEVLSQQRGNLGWRDG